MYKSWFLLLKYHFWPVKFTLYPSQKNYVFYKFFYLSRTSMCVCVCVCVCARANTPWFPVSLLLYNQMFLLDFKVKNPWLSLWMCLKIVYPIVPNVFADHYPYEKWLFHWEYTQHIQTNPYRNTEYKQFDP